MKNFVSALSLLILGLFVTISLAGCGSVQATSAATVPTPTPAPSPTPIVSSPGTPTPTPTATPTPSPVAAGTFVFSGSPLENRAVTGYRLNDDGTLTPIPGSPFPVNGALAVSGNFLVSAQDGVVVTFKIDPGTGSLTTAGSGDVPGPISVAADTANVYVAGQLSPAGSGTGIYGFSIAANGALTPLAGSPYFFAAGCDTCSSPLALTLNDNFLIQGGAGFQGIRNFTSYLRMSGGVLGTPQTLPSESGDRVAIQHPAGNFAYALDTSDTALDNFTIQANGTPAAGNDNLFSDNGQDIVVDNSGKFLLMVDLSGVVHINSIDPTDGSFTQIGTSVSAGAGAVSIAMDPSGKFVLVSQSATSSNLPGAVNQITVFTFDSASGAMKKLQSYPLGSDPGKAVIAKTQ